MQRVFAAQAAPVPLADGVSALGCSEEEVYIGTSSGALHRYALEPLAPSSSTTPVRRSIDQITRVPGTPYLALLSSSCVALTEAPYEKSQRLFQTRGARCFAAATWHESRGKIRSDVAVGLRGMDEIVREKQGVVRQATGAADGVQVSMLAVACARHLAVYRWVDGVFWDRKEVTLPHAPHALAILAGAGVFIGCSSTEYLRLDVPLASHSMAADVVHRSEETGRTALAAGDWIDEHAWPLYSMAIPEHEGVESSAGLAAWLTRTPKPVLLALSDTILLGLEHGAVLTDASGRIRKSPRLVWDTPPNMGTEIRVYTRDTLRLVQTLVLEHVLMLAAAPGPTVYMVESSRPRTYTLDSLRVMPWSDQLAELEKNGEYEEALALLHTLDTKRLADLAQRKARLQTLLGVVRFQQGAYEEAMDLFMENDASPAQVLALFPAHIAGEYTRHPSTWPSFFGVPEAPQGTAQDAPPAALQALARFLTDRRRVLRAEGACSKGGMDAKNAAHDAFASASATTNDTRLATAQAVDTALFKTFLYTKPALVGPLARVENWCVVSQVETLLKDHGMYDALVSLYHGKEMHREALALLRARSAVDGVQPTVRYLQALGAQHADLILEHSRHVLDQDSAQGLDIFTADAGQVGTLARIDVLEHLAAYRADVGIAYAQHLLALDDQDPAVHNRLAHLLLAQRRDAQLLDLVRSSSQYDAQPLLDALPPPPALAHVRAQLLGRLGRRREALRLYLDMHEVAMAESYCAEHTDPDLWQALLHFQAQHAPLDALLALLTRRAAEMDLVEALPLFPAHVPVQHVAPYLYKALRAGSTRRASALIVKGLATARDAALHRSVRQLQQRRVLVTASRTCPACQRRLGNAVLSVVPATGMTFHYYCAHRVANKG
ncbi:Vam6p [Malassezia vespertilionis]|uniref:Vam6p n=1 Tax=Malassezia vespertilionis TaxID=2020962 RepID=A0A2N1J8A5_9BASI|nr:Vam6p [Malassezia vespertilionis]